MNGQRVGYKRVSTVDQSTDRQLEGEVLVRTFEDRLSGKSAERPALLEMITYVRQGDEVVVHSMDRLARNLRDLLDLTTQLTNKGVTVTFLKEKQSLTGDDSSMAKLTLSMMGAFAEFERSLILERQREGIALAKGKGVYKGRKPKLTKVQEAEIRQLASTKTPRTELAKKYGISRGTLYNVLGQD